MRPRLGALFALLAGCTAKPAPEAAPPRTIEAAAATSAAGASAAPASAAGTSAAPGSAAGTSELPDASGVVADAARVKVATIGMHVGGGPYDEITKEPMKRSVEPRFADLAGCWKHVTSGPRPGDAGVDLVIEAAGGRARVSNPRTQIQGDGFVPCVVAFFESIEFEKPRNGKTVVSYSVRFTP
jgi:hypothetical protein